MTRFLKSGWFASFLGTLLFLGTMALVWRPPAVLQAPHELAEPSSSNLGVRDPELDC
jgi:hypothetical protein